MRRALLFAALLMGLVLPDWASAQGILININPSEHVPLPRPIIIYPPHIPPPHHRPSPPPSSYKIKELSVNVRLTGQVAKTQVTQSFVNTGSVQMEVAFVFPLPYDGAVEQMTLLVDGKEFPAKLLAAADARKVYEEIVRKNRDPALLEWLGSGMFKTSVFPVPPGAERKVVMSYSQLCRHDRGLVDYQFPLSTAKYTSHPVEKVDVRVSLETAEPIKNIYSPSQAVEIQRPDDKHAVVTWTARDTVPAADFRLLYDVGAGKVGTSVISYRPKTSDEGYFLLLASPEVKADGVARTAKSVVFVIDHSGSMAGEKMEQAKNALKFMLNGLHEGDSFNVVAFDSKVESFKPELQPFNDETRQAALGFAAGLYPGSGTNIHDALDVGMKHLTDSSRPSLVIFLTDGIPTEGQTGEAQIVDGARKANHVRARLFAFGVGYDVNSRLLDKLVRENFGQSEYVRPNENIEARVGSFYSRIQSPVLTGVKLKFEFDTLKTEEGSPVSRLYPGGSYDLFAGEQLVVVGRYKKFGAAKVVVSGQLGGKAQTYAFPATFTESSSDASNGFVEKLWAVRRIGEIIDELDLKGKNQELVQELVRLSLQHGVMTPYTSFLADENVDRRDMAANATRAGEAAEALRESAGQAGFAQRALKGYYQNAAQAPVAGPHPTAPGGATFGTSGGLGLGGGGSPSVSAASAAKMNNVADAFKAVEKEKKDGSSRRAEQMQNVGRKTFYRRADRWVDADVTKEQEAKVVKIERFSPEYFDLAEKHGADVAKYLAIDEPVLVEIAGQAYAF